MAAVHLGRLVGPAGFARTVAVKQLHAALSEDRDAVEMLIQEARIASRLHHPNVAATLDVVVEHDGAFLIMDYVHGESLARLVAHHRQTGVVPSRVATAILSGALRGLHAAHEARNERGEPLEVVHRDVSPQNILVGADGVARLIDFGIAKARMRAQTTAEGQLKGKLSYLAPEQIGGQRATRRTDVYSAGVVLWETLTGRRLFDGDCAGAITEQILLGWVDPPSKYVPELSEHLDRVVLRALETEPERRFATAEAMAIALERAELPAPATEVGNWVAHTARDALAQREALLRSIEASQPFLRSRQARFVKRAMVAGIPLLLASATAIALHARSASTPPPPSATAPSAESGKISDHAAMPRPERISQPAIAEPVSAVPPAREATVSVSSRPAVTAPRRKPGPLRQPHADDCEPPYSVTSDGIRIYKRDCLRK
jgi:eukaryotic-like serine/threonine-protein kinase